jgi:hypothetical protein
MPRQIPRRRLAGLASAREQRVAAHVLPPVKNESGGRSWRLHRSISSHCIQPDFLEPAEFRTHEAVEPYPSVKK